MTSLKGKPLYSTHTESVTMVADKLAPRVTGETLDKKRSSLRMARGSSQHSSERETADHDEEEDSDEDYLDYEEESISSDDASSTDSTESEELILPESLRQRGISIQRQTFSKYSCLSQSFISCSRETYCLALSYIPAIKSLCSLWYMFIVIKL